MSIVHCGLQLRDAVESLKNLWDLMDSSEEERKPFEKVATVLGSSEVDVMCSGVFSLETIKQVNIWIDISMHYCLEKLLRSSLFF